MLPTAKQYLTRAGLSDGIAVFTLTGLFLAGVIVIRIISAFIHRYIPSHIAHCTHSHDPHAPDLEHGHEHGEMEEHHDHHDLPGPANGNTERSPLLAKKADPRQPLGTLPRNPGHTRPMPPHRESMHQRWRRQLNQLLGGVKAYCDDDGPCYGVSQTCGQECSKILGPRAPSTSTDPVRPLDPVSPFSLPRRAATVSGDQHAEDEPETPLTVRRVSVSAQDDYPPHRPMAPESQGADYFSQPPYDHHPSPVPEEDEEDMTAQSSGGSMSETMGKPWEQHLPPSQHHHHVPQNAFLSIGLQTSLAIALHKLPEGFITYATNHANPTLGLTIFLALFIHNITEGFAMALPLFLALNSRWKAMLWSSLLGGISQPAGAGIAALWIWCANRADGNPSTDGPSWGVYGGMFAATAGVMTSVALQLFSEGLSLTHNRELCIGSAIAGMGVLGISFALTA
jgi:ZIP family zinc transporter